MSSYIDAKQKQVCVFKVSMYLQSKYISSMLTSEERQQDWEVMIIISDHNNLKIKEEKKTVQWWWNDAILYDKCK